MNSKLVFYFCTEVNSTLNDEIKAPPSVRKLFNRIAINYMVTRASGPKQQTEKKATDSQLTEMHLFNIPCTIRLCAQFFPDHF